MLLAMAIGVASVIVLTSLGEGARRYVAGQFASLGTNLIIVFPGYSETAGVGAGFVAATTRDLTLEDALALQRHPHVEHVSPINIGVADINYRGRQRTVTLLGSNSALLAVRHWKLSKGRFLPKMDLTRAKSVCVIGSNIRKEIFGPRSAIGEWIRLGDRRFRVIGIMASEGRSIGVDVQDIVIIPIASAQTLLNTSSIFRILVDTKSRSSMPGVKQFIRDTIKRRHQGEEDITVITQDAVLATFDKILKALTYAVGAIAAISLGVAGILTMNVMLVAVSQRRSEIGLLKALGASRRTITLIFLYEACLLALLGATLGLVLGELGSWGIRAIFPQLPAYAPGWAIITAIAIALGTSIIFSLLPARRASRLDPVVALTGK